MDMKKYAKLAGISVATLVSIGAKTAKAGNGIVTDVLGASNSLAKSFSGDSSPEIAPKIYNKASNQAFDSVVSFANWSKKKMR